MAQMVSIWDLQHESGPAEIRTHTVNAAEMVDRDPARYVRELPDGVTPGPKSGPVRRIVMVSIAGLMLALASLWSAPPADAASVVLCAPHTLANQAGAQINIPNLSKSYVADGQGCVVGVGLNDIAVLRASGYQDGGDLRSIVFNSGVATGTTSFLMGQLPAGAYIQQIVAQNITANAAGSISIGSTSGGADVVAATALAANGLDAFPGTAAVAKPAFSSTAPQSLFITSTAWNSANVNVTVVYGYW